MLLTEQDKDAFQIFRKQFEKYTEDEAKLAQCTLASIKDFELSNETVETAFVKFKVASLESMNEYDTKDVKLEKQNDAWKVILGKQLIGD